MKKKKSIIIASFIFIGMIILFVLALSFGILSYYNNVKSRQLELINTYDDQQEAKKTIKGKEFSGGIR